MNKTTYWFGWLYQYFFWSAFVLFGWYFLVKNWGPTQPFWTQASTHKISAPATPHIKSLK